MNGESLPIFILANWRGFSGGARDMFDEVLKFGSMIVDALRDCKQPVFVYIPPLSELRGGAWVVVDSKINPDVMEMFADETARGGVLEATGAASIKFRTKELLKMAHRVDPILRSLDFSLSQESPSFTYQNKDGEEEEKGDSSYSSIQAQIQQRERLLLPIYSQIAVHFADLHDTPGRMEEVRVIERVVKWQESRSFFYWRLRRKLAEMDLKRQVVTALRGSPSSQEEMGDSTHHRVGRVSQMILEWYLRSIPPREGMGNWEDLWFDNDQHVLVWMKENTDYLRSEIDTLTNQSICHQTHSLFSRGPEAVMKTIKNAMRGFSQQERNDLLQLLNES